ncbi:MAG TPA: hypothetical protein VHP37_15455 [Burkholderiales bacterium]|nr:hypothetical protein [Burkholderiales bacterium]
MGTPESIPTQERRTRWSFAYHADNTWYWQAKRASGELNRSEVKLETLADALTDAMAHGYIAWSRTEERRRERPEELVDE